MITQKEYDNAVSVIKQYKTEQLVLLRIKRSKTAKTSLLKADWGVHRTHCCFEHGCKYNNAQCPVALGLVEQDYLCEDCNEDNINL